MADEMHGNVFQVQNTFMADMSPEAKRIVREKEAEIAKLQADLESYTEKLMEARYEVEDLRDQLSQLEKTDTGVLRKQMDTIKQHTYEAAQEVRRFVQTVGLVSQNDEGYGLKYADERIPQWIKQVQSGAITAQEAIAKIKVELASLIDENYRTGQGSFGVDILSQFQSTLSGVATAVGEMQTSFTTLYETIANGGAVGGTGGSALGGGGGAASTLEALKLAMDGMSADAQSAYQPVTQLLEKLVEYGSIDNTKLASIAMAFDGLANVMQGRFGVKSLSNLQTLMGYIKELGAAGTVSFNFDVKGLNDLQNKRAPLKNLAEYLPKIARIDTTKLEALSKINLTNFNNIKVSKASIESIAQLAESLKMLQDMPGLIEGIERKTSGGSPSNTPLALEGRASRLLNNAVKFQERNPGYDTIGLNLLVKDIEELRSLVRGLDSTNEQAITNASNRLKHLGVELDNVIADAEKLRLEQERATHNNADVNRRQLLSRVGLLGETDRLQNMLARIGGTTAQLNGGDQFEARLARYTARAKELGETITKTAANDEAELGRLRQAVERLMNNIVQLDTEVKGMQTQEKLAADVEKVSGGLTTLEGKLVTLKGTLSGMADSKPFMGQFESISAAIAQMKTLAENTDIGKPDQVRSLTTLYDALVQRVNEYTVAVRNGKSEDANTSNKEMQSLIAQLDWLDKIAKKRREIQHMYDVNDKVHGTATGAAMQQSIARLDALYNKLLQMDGLTTQQRQEVTRMFKEISIGATSAKQSMEQLGQTGQTMLSKFKAGLQKFGGWTIVTRALTAVIRLARQLVTNVKEIDTAMGQLRIVTGATASEMNKFSKEIAETSKKIGASITDLTDSATVYARLGYTLEESNTLAKYTSMLSKVGDIDVSDAQSAITAITKAFTDIDINKIEDVMNKLVKTGKESCPTA